MNPQSNSEIVADLAEAFVESHRSGQCPCIDDYVQQHPHLEQEIRDLFPTLLVVENLAPDQDASVVGDDAEQIRSSKICGVSVGSDPV